MAVIGLTGGIASGKTTVQAMLVELGATVLDADQIYRQLISPQGGPSPLARQIEARFPGVLGPDGVIDRPRLARRVFADTGERRALEAITHPAVAAAFAERVAELTTRGVEPVVYDVPLLYERGLEAGMAGVIVVWVPREVQQARLSARDRHDPVEADRRLAAQLPLDDKRRRATWVVDNTGSLADTRRQVEQIWPLARAAGRSG